MNLHYSSLVLLATLIALSGCSSSTRSTGSTGKATLGADAIQRARSNSSIRDERRTLVDVAGSWIGTPYKFGGTSKAGTDCSGFVCNIFNAIGKKLPRSSSDQAGIGALIRLDDALPGDLVFFNTSGSGVSHVGMLLDGGAFIHASTSKGVIVSNLSEKYYSRTFLFARRVIA